MSLNAVALNKAVARGTMGAAGVALIFVLALIGWEYLLPQDSYLPVQPDTADRLTRKTLPSQNDLRSLQRSLSSHNPWENRSVLQKAEQKSERVIESKLDLVLWGTMVQPGAQSWAVVSSAKQKNDQELVSVGDVIENATVERIERYALYLRNGSSLEVISMEEQKARDRFAKKQDQGIALPISRPGVEYELSRSQFAKYVGQGISLLKGTSFAPYNNGADTLGYQLKLSESALFREFGLKNGDIVESINGIAVTDSSKVAGLMRNMNKQSLLEVNLLRNGEARSVTVNIQ